MPDPRQRHRNPAPYTIFAIASRRHSANPIQDRTTGPADSQMWLSEPARVHSRTGMRADETASDALSNARSHLRQRPRVQRLRDWVESSIGAHPRNGRLSKAVHQEAVRANRSAPRLDREHPSPPWSPLISARCCGRTRRSPDSHTSGTRNPALWPTIRRMVDKSFASCRSRHSSAPPRAVSDLGERAFPSAWYYPN